MDDEQLLEFDREQAEQQLNDEQLERYNELKKEELEGAIEDQKTEDGITAAEGLAAMREAAEKEVTVDVHGIEFLADINPSQLSQLGRVAKFEDRKVDSLETGELNKIRSNLLDVLAELSVNFSREEWGDEFGDAGLVTLGNIVGNLMSKVEDVMEQKKSR